MWTDSTLRDYLLGSAPPETAEQIEARLLEDDDLFAALRNVEDDLFDASARGTLDTESRARFAERYGHETERLRFAQALARKTVPSAPAVPLIRRPWMPWAAAAALILVAGAVFTQLEAPSTPPGPPTTATAPRAETPFTVALALGASRASGATTNVSVPAGTTVVIMNVQLDPGDRFDTYAMELRGAGDRVVWSAADLKAISGHGDLAVMGRIPTASVPAGSYELAVRGGGTDLGFIPLTVRWSP